ncbi:MAG: ABC transporter ATP-binding protein [Thermaurantiacus sp.]
MLIDADTSGAAVLRLEGVSFARGGQSILDHVSLAVDAGVHHLLLGPSGSGKTTLLNLVAGLLTPDSGRVVVAGSEISSGAPSARDALRRQHIGIVFQTIRLVAALTVAENLALAQRLAGRPDQSLLHRVLDRLGIARLAGSKPRELSQGEAQRAAIARAIVTRPTLLLADEPTSALDDGNAARVADLLLESAAETGATLLVATHDARLLAHIPAHLRLGTETAAC